MVPERRNPLSDRTCPADTDLNTAMQPGSPSQSGFGLASGR